MPLILVRPGCQLRLRTKMGLDRSSFDFVNEDPGSDGDEGGGMESNGSVSDQHG